jgi:GT2 family glycosyltransferase/glycosyltransferase involved in cell wall biosynthesis
MSESVSTYKKLIVVLGMHRSGTSAISRGLQVMGVELGDRLMPPNMEVNAKGFWEDVDINSLNIEMFKALGSDWHHLVPIKEQDVELLHNKGFFIRAVELIRHKTGGTSIFGFKDPRLAKLLPFWKEVFAHCNFDVRYILAVRHPLSVVKSLEKRDGLDAVKSYVLWLEHVLASLEGTTGSKRVVVDFDLLMHAAEQVLKRIANQLDLKIDSQALISYKADFLDENLRHSVCDFKDLLSDNSCLPLVHEVYGTLLKLATDQVVDDEPMRRKVETWVHEYERIIPVFGLVDRLTIQNESFAREQAKQIRVFAEQEAQIAEQEAQIAEQEAQIAEQEAQIASRNEQLAMRDEQLFSINERIALLDKQVSQLTDETILRGEWALRLDQQLKEAQTTINQITSSSSWRITLPLREARRWFSTPKAQAKRYLKRALLVVKAFYFRLPLKAQTRSGIKRFAAKYFPWVFRVSSDHHIAAPTNQDSLVSIPPISDLSSAARRIELKTSLQPLVSIIIPVYGQCEYTLRCLLSIADHQPSTLYEVIVVDDCSADDSLEILEWVMGIQLIHNAVNQGFIRSCNIGAKVAKGRFVYFLNNDTQITAGWLDELVSTFEIFPGTGLVGSKLVYPDGTLQEAGGIIWRNGSAWNFGRNQNPLLPIFNYAREVDYCSGASIMVPKVLFDELEGFDEHYLPAYCEDADLALKIRNLGYRVIYQPLSVVVHFEGITSGTDTSTGVKAYQIENSKKLFERWQNPLLSHQAPGEDVDDAKDRCAIRRVLVLDHCTPTPDQDAGSVTVYNLLVLMREMGFQVTFIPEHNFLYMPGYTDALQRAGIEVLYAPFVTSVAQHLKSHGQRYDLAFLFRPGVVESNLETVRKYCPTAKVLFHTVDLHYLRMSREADLLSDPAKQEAVCEMKRKELAAIQAVDASIVHSTAELELLHLELQGQKIHVFPLILDVVGTNKSFDERRDIVFVGGYQHTPNVDAVQYFTAEIMPRLRERLPGVRFYVVGSKPPAEVLALAGEDVIISGFVEDLNSLLNNMRLSVAPLRYGAGIKGKIGTAMAVGLPTVATPIAAEGMSLTDGENILVADGADDFAKAVIRLYEEEILWASISESSIRFADSTWGAEAAWKILANILGEMDIDTRRDDRPLKLYSNQSK